jgi:Dolichyl-phosphate-mannose-protein mannosyltransferase
VTGGRTLPRRRWSVEARVVGALAAVQTFVFFARHDRYSVLLWWTRESWLLVLLLWMKDLALAAAAFFLFARMTRVTIGLPEPTDPSDRRSRRTHALLFIAILAAGVALRWVLPRQIPPGVWTDALYEAEGALRDPGNVSWLGGRPLEIGQANSALVSHLYLKLCVLLFRIFGRGEIGILALSAVGGSLALPAIYWLGREIGSRTRALAAMAILAFASWPLVFSRWAWTGALLLPLVLGAAALVLRALRTGRALPAFLGGALVGLSLHTHPAAWVAAAGLAAFGLSVLRPRRAGPLFAAAALGAFLAFLPFGVAYLKYPERLGGRGRDVPFTGRTADVIIGPVSPPLRLLHNAIEYTGIVLWTRDPNPRHGLPDRPPFPALLGVAALTGAAISLARARSGDEKERLLLFLAGATLLAGLLSNPGGAPNLSRVYTVAGVLALWAAGALVRWMPAAARTLAARPGFAWTLALALLLAVETRVFLAVWPRDYRVVGSFCVADTDAGRTAGALGRAPIILEPNAISCPITLETLAAAAADRPVARLDRRSAEDLLRSPPDGPFWFVARDIDLEVLRRAAWRCLPRRHRETASEISVFRVAPPR